MGFKRGRAPARRMKIALTPGQAVCLHGWWHARPSLTWPDVLANDALTFARLASVNLREQDLYLLQPDLQAWIKLSRVTLADCPRMRAWDAHPIRDFKADLADLISMRWPADSLVRMGVTYAELQSLGVTAETMALFNYTLMMWASLGFQRAHAVDVPHNTLYRLFNMSKQDVLACLK